MYTTSHSRKAKKKHIYKPVEARHHPHATYIHVSFKFVAVFLRFFMGVDGGEALSTVPVSEQASGLDLHQQCLFFR